jgi:hypothetical protein
VMGAALGIIPVDVVVPHHRRLQRDWPDADFAGVPSDPTSRVLVLAKQE